MYLRFEDWSPFIDRLDAAGIDHGSHIIKIFASSSHPENMYPRNNLAIIEIDGSPFGRDEVFDYGDRGSYLGVDLEAYLADLRLTDPAKEVARSLFRFANWPETQFCQTAMSLRNRTGGWLINHPFSDLDGLIKASNKPGECDEQIHLDIFIAASLERLFTLIAYQREESTTEPGPIISFREVHEYGRRRRVAEKNATGRKETN